MRYVSTILLATVVVCAQSDLSTIRGVATDQSGAVAPGIKVTLTDVERNTARSGVTGADGTYEIPFLVPGIYKLVGTGTGFKDFVAEQIRLSSRETRRIDMTFEVGQVGTSVSVTADAAVIATEGSQVANGFNKQ